MLGPDTGRYICGAPKETYETQCYVCSTHFLFHFNVLIGFVQAGTKIIFKR